MAIPPPRSSRLSQFLRCFLAVLLTCLVPSWATAQTLVAVASNVKSAAEEIAAAFEQSSGQSVRLSFGSSGNFFRQIQQGAPYQLFLSADEDFVHQLAAAGLSTDPGVVYAVGRLAIVVPNASPVKADAELKDLAAALRDGRLKKWAIANPALAPYGARAREALQHAGLWDALQNHLVLGENIAQATQFALSGSTQGGIVAYSLALAPAVAKQSRFALIPQAWHQPLTQRMVLLPQAGETARAFYAFLQTPAAQTIFQRHGYGAPQER